MCWDTVSSLSAAAAFVVNITDDDMLWMRCPLMLLLTCRHREAMLAAALVIKSNWAGDCTTDHNIRTLRDVCKRKHGGWKLAHEIVPKKAKKKVTSMEDGYRRAEQDQQRAPAVPAGGAAAPAPGAGAVQG